MSKEKNQQKEENHEKDVNNKNPTNDLKDQINQSENDKMTKSDEKTIGVDQNEEKINDLTNLLKRVQAEFSNYMKRTENEKSLLVKNANKDLILKLIPVLDNFELALKNFQNDENVANGNNNENNNDFFENNKNIIDGINMVYLQLLKILESEGLTFIENEKFNPNFHEAISVEKSSKDDGTILEVLRNGYLLNGAVLRHSLVKVSKKN